MTILRGTMRTKIKFLALEFDEPEQLTSVSDTTVHHSNDLLSFLATGVVGPSPKDHSFESASSLNEITKGTFSLATFFYTNYTLT